MTTWSWVLRLLRWGRNRNINRRMCNCKFWWDRNRINIMRLRTRFPKETTLRIIRSQSKTSLIRFRLNGSLSNQRSRLLEGLTMRKTLKLMTMTKSSTNKTNTSIKIIKRCTNSNNTWKLYNLLLPTNKYKP